MKLIITVLLMTAFTIQAAFSNQSVDLSKGTPAPYDGVLLDKERANSVKNELIEKDYLQRSNESLNKSINLYKDNENILNQKSDILLKQNTDLIKNLNESRSVSTWEKVGFFILGVAVTGAAVYGASRLK